MAGRGRAATLPAWMTAGGAGPAAASAMTNGNINQSNSLDPSLEDTNRTNSNVIFIIHL